MADSDKARIVDTPSSESSIPLILSIIALLLAVIAVIIGAVSLSQKTTNNYVIGGDSSSSSAQSGEGITNYEDDYIWTMSIGHDASRWEYLDEASGLIKGFDVDIVNAVCKIAYKNCRLVADVYQRCWDAQAGEAQRGGEGLFNGYYDACTAWSHSYDRARTFQFTVAFTKTSIAVFVVKPGNPNAFNWRDIRGKTIGFIDGYVYDEFCVSREDDLIQGAALPAENIRHYIDRDALIAGVLAGEVDAAFDAKEYYSNYDGLDVVSDEITSCAIDGYSLMMHKRSRIGDWWNPAFERLLATTEYRTICNDLKEQHGHIPGPNPEDICIGLQ